MVYFWKAFKLIPNVQHVDKQTAANSQHWIPVPGGALVATGHPALVA